MGATRALYRASLWTRISRVGLVAGHPTRPDALEKEAAYRAGCLVNLMRKPRFH